MVGRDDRAAHFARPEGDILVVADGAGGTGGGGAAADAVLAAVSRCVAMRETQGWVEVLTRLDAEGLGGESTAVVCCVFEDRVVGASVGDSGAWLLEHDAVDDLTQAQRRKPLLGSGRAAAVPFAARLGDRTLLLASDGLLKYTSAERIAATVVAEDLQANAVDLLDLVRLRSGALPDDVAILLARRR